jgi:peroxiredoxin
VRVPAILALLAASVPVFSADLPRKSPEFTLSDVNGKESLLSTYRGKVLVVAFVYTTCPHCQAFSAMVEKLYKELGPRGFEPIDIAWNDNARNDIGSFTEQLGLTFPIFFSTYDPIMSYMGFSIMDRPVVPLVVVIDRKGMIRAQSPPQGDPNLQDETKLRTMIETLLKEPTTSAHRQHR